MHRQVPDRKAGEVVQLEDDGQHGLDVGEPRQLAVDPLPRWFGIGHHLGDRVEGDLDAGPLVGALAARPVDEDLPHVAAENAQEVVTIMEPDRRGVELQERLVDELGGLERRAVLLAPEEIPRDRAELVVRGRERLRLLEHPRREPGGVVAIGKVENREPLLSPESSTGTVSPSSPGCAFFHTGRTCAGEGSGMHTSPPRHVALVVSALLVMGAVTALAQPEIVVGTASGFAGDTVELPVSLVAGGSAAALQLDLTYDADSIQPGSLTAGTALADHVLDWEVVGTGRLRVTITTTGPSLLSSGDLCRVQLAIDDAAEPGRRPVNIEVAVISDDLGSEVVPTALRAGAVDVLTDRPPAEVPTLNGWGLGAMIALLAMVGVLALRRGAPGPFAGMLLITVCLGSLMLASPDQLLADILAGDANGDGSVDAADVPVIVDQILQRAQAPGNPDCNQDLAIDVRDTICVVLGGGSPGNHAPALDPISDQTVVVGDTLQIDAEAADPDSGDVLTFSFDLAPGGMSLDPDTGVISWTPTEDDVGVHDVTVRVTDLGGLFDTGSFQVTVALEPSPPTLDPISDQSLRVGEILTLTAHASDPDLPGDKLAFSLVEHPVGCTIDRELGNLLWLPGAGQAGTHPVTVKVTDSFGLSDQTSFEVDVRSPGGPPVLDPIADQFTVEGVPLTLTATATDPDLPSDTLSFSLPLAPSGASINPETGELSWTPSGAQVGVHDLSVQVTDQEDLLDFTSFSVTVGSVNEAPVAVDDVYIAPPGTTISPATPGVIANDSDPNGDPLTASLVSGVRYGDLTLRPDGSFDYTPGIDAFVPDLKQRLGDIIGPGPYSRGIATPSPVVADLDRDGIPEIILSWYEGGLTRSLRIYNGATGELEHELTSALSDVTAQDNDAMPAVGNLDDDPELEIAIAGICQDQMIVFEHDLTLKWSTSLGSGDPDCAGDAQAVKTTLADLDGDGTPEILIPTQGAALGLWGIRVFNADGNVRWERDDIPIGSNTGQASVAVADVDLDGEPEISLGAALLSADGDIEWIGEFPATGGSYPDAAVIANLDDDPFAEIVLAGYSQLLALNHDGTLLWDAVALNPEVTGYPNRYFKPLVADLDGDGEVEIAAGNFNSLTVLERDGTLKWQKPVCVAYPDGDHCSQVKGLTAFDFDGDGVSEIVAQLFQEGMVVVRGSDGTRLWSTTVYQGPAAAHTALHTTQPLVADVDGDGHAELVAVQGSIQNEQNCNSDGDCVDHGVYIYQGLGDDWMPARRIFNQQAYHNTNVLDDGTVPAHEQPHWLTPGLNRDRVNVPLAEDDDLVDRFSYRVSDGEFQSNTATVLLPIRPPNRPPRILSAPPTIVGAGFAYRYQVLAADEDLGDVLSFALTASPGGMTMDDGGVVRWQPSTADLGPHPVTVAVTDQEGAGDVQAFMLQVVEPQPVPDVVGLTQAAAEAAIDDAGFVVGDITEATHPTIPTGAVAGQSPRGGSEATPGSAVDLVVSLGPSPEDIDNDGDGISENQGDCDDTDPTIHPGAVDLDGDGIDQDCDGVDGTQPVQEIVILPSSLTLLEGETVQLTAFGVFADGTAQNITEVATWSAAGSSATVDPTGLVAAVAGGSSTTVSAARDGVAGSIEVAVIAPDDGDTEGATAEIAAPVDGATVRSPIDVIGTAADANLVRYELAISPAGREDFTAIGGGTTSVGGGVLGQLDPTLMINGLYTLRLVVLDAGGNETSDRATVQVDGQQKVGAFTLTLNDLEVPVAGIPIVVQRSYDSRRHEQGAFGYGWELGIQTLQIRLSGILGEGWSVVHPSLSFALVPASQHTVSVLLPGGAVDVFDLVPDPAVSPLIPFFSVHARYQPRPGTRGTLEPLDNPYLVILDAQPGPVQLIDDTTFDAYDPRRFRYTSPDGTSFVVATDNGLESYADADGNQLVIDAAGIHHSNGTEVTFQRDDVGRIVAITDPEGHTHHYRYDGSGDLRSYRDALDNETTFSYDLHHGLLEVHDPLGNRAVRNEYDDDGRLTAHVDALGNRVEYSHDVGARVETVSNRLGHLTVHEYDEDGNITATTDALGRRWERTYDADGNELSFTDPLGHTTQRSYDADGNLLSVMDPTGAVTSMSYDGEGHVMTVTDPLGHTTAYAYDERGNRIGVTDAGGNETTFAYDEAGNLVLSQNAAGYVRTRTVAGNGLPTSETDAEGNLSTLTYDGAGNLLSEESTLTGGSGSAAVHWDYGHDAMGQMTAITTPVTTTPVAIDWNAVGQLAGSTDPLGNSWQALRDPVGNLVGRSIPGQPDLTVGYDAEGHETSATSPGGNQYARTYDAVGQVLSETAPDTGPVTQSWDPAGRLASRTDALGNHTTFSYDDAGRRTATTRSGGAVTNFGYDNAGQLVSTTDPEGNTTTFTRDPLGRVTHTMLADGSESMCAYDEVGNEIFRLGADGLGWTSTYGGNQQLLSVTDDEGETTSYGYDTHGNVIVMSDAAGRSTRAEADPLGRIVRRQLPDGQLTTCDYDALARPTSCVGFDGRTTTYAYDPVARRVDRFGPEDAVSRFFDADGRMVRVDDPRGTTVMTRDAAGRLTGWTEPAGEQVGSGYDLAGRRSSFTTSSGTTTLARNGRGELVGLTSGPHVATYTRDLDGRLTTAVFPDGTTLSREYDPLGRPTRITYAAQGGETLRNTLYTRDGQGRVTTVEVVGESLTTYSYDTLGRLIEEQVEVSGEPPAVTSYTYDAVGNRVSQTDQAGSRTLTYDADDRLLEDGLRSYAWSPNGNLLTRSGPTATESFSYDDRGRLVRFVRTGDSPTVVDYAYDVDGLLASRTEGGQTTTLLWDRAADGLPQLLEERTGGSIRRFFNDGFLAAYAIDQAGTTTVLIDDMVGTPVATAVGGAINQQMPVDAFGVPRGAPPTQAGIGFGGGYRDAASGLVFLRSRWYQPDLGRFIQPDRAAPRLEDPRTLNRYAYAFGDPVNLFDPSGQITLAGVVAYSSIAFSTLATLEIVALNPREVVGSGFGARNVWRHLFQRKDASFAPLFLDISLTGGTLEGLGVGIGLTGGLEALDFFKLDQQAIYFFFGSEAGFGATSDAAASVGVARPVFRQGGVYDTPTPDDYRGWFVSTALSAGFATADPAEEAAPGADGAVELGGAPWSGISLAFFWSPAPTYWAEPDTGRSVSNPDACPQCEARNSHGYRAAVAAKSGLSASLSLTWYWKLPDLGIWP